MIGQTLAHYRITGLLGRGGMGEVYRARDIKLDRDVALKILPETLARDSARLARFDREARTVAALNHPNIVHMYSVEEDAGVRFLTMELVEGQELASMIPGEGLPVERVLEIGLAVADALAAAHQKGIVHRDLKPANVMVSGDGHVKVLDFGLAKLAHEEADDLGNDATRALELTQQGAMLGTVPYMSPEQLRARETDHRSDIFSLGVLLHEITTGRRPFEGETAADVTSAILKDEPSGIREARPELPVRLERIVGRCLAKEREGRYDTARAVGDELRELRRRVDSGLAEPEAPRREKSGRSRGQMFALVALLMLAAAAMAWWASSDRGPDASRVDRPVVAVLPFENLGSEDDEYFAAGITDEITSRLALIQGLGVISRTSARVYANTDRSIPEVARELGADYVLEGAIRWDKTGEPGRVRITPRLIRVEDDTNLWSSNFERDVTEIFSLQATIASRIAEALDVTLMAPVRAALEARPTENIDAYQAYLQGLRQLNAPGFSRESFDLGVQMFERAVELDPAFALAHARLSSMHARMYHYGFDRSEERLAAAEEAADRALALRSDLAETRLALAHYYYWGTQQYDRALAELGIALQLEPNNSELWLTSAYVRRRQGDMEVAIELLERVRALSPLDANVVIALGETYGTLRRFAQAEEPLRRAIALAPDDPYPYTELALVHLRWRGDAVAARDALRAMPVVGGGESYRVRALVELFARRYDHALQVLDACPVDAFEAGAFHLPVDLWKAMVLGLTPDTGGARAAFESARVVLERRLAEDPLDHRTHSALGLTLAGLGRAEDAVLHGQRAVELDPLQKDALAAPVQVFHLALIHAMLGDADAAVAQLERVLSIPSTVSIAWLDGDPRWDGVRKTQAYAALVERLGRS